MESPGLNRGLRASKGFNGDQAIVGHEDGSAAGFFAVSSSLPSSPTGKLRTWIETAKETLPLMPSASRERFINLATKALETRNGRVCHELIESASREILMTCPACTYGVGLQGYRGIAKEAFGWVQKARIIGPPVCPNCGWGQSYPARPCPACQGVGE